jgi:hypothetical protein
VSCRSCVRYTPSQAAYERVSLPLTKVVLLSSLTTLPSSTTCYACSPIACFARSPTLLPILYRPYRTTSVCPLSRVCLSSRDPSYNVLGTLPSKTEYCSVYRPPRFLPFPAFRRSISSQSIVFVCKVFG